MTDEVKDCPHGRPNGALCKFGCFVRMAMERERARAPDVVAPVVMTDEARAAHDKRKWTTRHSKNRFGR